MSSLRISFLYQIRLSPFVLLFNKQRVRVFQLLARPLLTVSAWYYVSFMDDYSNFCWFFPLSSKSQVYEKIILFQKRLRIFSCQIKYFQSDWEGKVLATLLRTRPSTSFCQTNLTCKNKP